MPPRENEPPSGRSQISSEDLSRYQELLLALIRIPSVDAIREQDFLPFATSLRNVVTHEVARSTGRFDSWWNRGTPHEQVNLEDQVQELQRKILEIEARQTLGIDEGQAAVHRTIPVRIYLSEYDRATVSAVEAELASLLDNLQFFTAYASPPIRRSYFSELFSRSRDKLTPEQFATSVEKLERALGVKLHDVPQSQVDLNKAESTARIVTSLAGVAEAVINVGSIVVIKHDGCVFSFSLTAHELSLMERRPEIWTSPADALRMLNEMREQSATELARLTDGSSVDEASRG